MHTDPHEILAILKKDYPHADLDFARQVVAFGESAFRQVWEGYKQELRAQQKPKQKTSSSNESKSKAKQKNILPG